ncbi:MAG: hypothetical protein ABI174_07175 [Chitinophagaceae bacterium]
MSFENRPLNYQGTISYGLYVYHMPVIYATSCFFKKLPGATENSLIYFPAYALMVFGLTISISWASYSWIEKPLITRGKRSL